MTFSRVKPANWSFGEILTSSQMNTLDTDHANAVDGAAGGTFSPTAAIILAAKGLQMTGIFDVPGSGLYNVKRYDATGDGVADDTAEIQAAEDAVAATSAGGYLMFPPGTYRITADLVKKHKVHWLAAPGTVTITMDHATEKFLTFTGSAWTRESIVYGINFEAAQSNTGIFCDDSSVDYILKFQHCKLNNSAALIAGQLFAQSGSPTLTLEDCDFRAVKVNANHFPLFRQTFIRGKLTMAPAATSELIATPSNGSTHCDGTELVHVSTVGNVAFFDGSAGVTRVVNARFNVDDSGAGAGTYAIRVNGGTIFTSGCDLLMNTDVLPYEYVSLAAAPSVLQLKPALRIDGLTGDVTLTTTQGFESFIIETSKATAPNVTPPPPLFPGQRMSLVLRNVSGGTWPGNPSFVGMAVETADLSGLEDDDYITVSCVALDFNDDGSAVWIQDSMPGIIA